MIERFPITDPDQWHSLRRRDVTASQIGGLFGCHRHWTTGKIYAEKMGLPVSNPDPESSVIKRGNILEPIVAGLVREMHPDWNIIKATDYIRDPQVRIGATVDYLVDAPRGRGVLECKTVGSGIFRRDWGGEEGEKPLWIVLQTATQMMLEGCSWGVIAALVVGDYVFDLHVAEVERDPEAEERLKDAALQFWSAIEKGEIPALDPQRDADVVRLMYPTTTPDKVIDLSRDNRILELLDERETAAAEEKAAEERKDAAETELRAKIQDAEIALVPGWKVTLRTTNRKAHMVKATSYRTLRATRERAACVT